jgi:hypothetical protein
LPAAGRYHSLERMSRRSAKVYVSMPLGRGQTKTALILGSSFVRARQKAALRRVFIFHLTLLRASRRRNLEAEPRSCFIILPNIKRSGVWVADIFLFRFIRPFCPTKQSCKSGGAGCLFRLLQTSLNDFHASMSRRN